MDKLLLLEDDRGLIDGLQYSLVKNGFEIKVVETVKDAIMEMSGEKKYDLLLLDVSLPDGTGFEVCDYVRKSGNLVPIIFLTAAEEETNVIRGLDSGADDYVTKPFKLGELCSRIRALLRRVYLQPELNSLQSSSSILTTSRLSTSRMGGEKLWIDLIGSKVYLEGQLLELTAAEYRLICLLVKNANHIVTRPMILDTLWDGNGKFVDDNTLSVYIRRLREKIEENPSKPQHLQTARGLGYEWKD